MSEHLTRTEQQDFELYSLMGDLGDSAVRERFQVLKDQGKIDQTTVGARLIADSAGKVIAAVKVFMERGEDARGRPSARVARIRELVRDVGVERSVLIGLRTTLAAVTRNHTTWRKRTTNSIRGAIGYAIKEEMDWRHLKSENPSLFGYAARNSGQRTARERSGIKKRLQESLAEKDCGWSSEDVLMVGALVLQCIMDFGGLIEQELTFRSDDPRAKAKRYALVALKPDVLKWMQDGNNYLAAVRPRNLPITTPPLDWGPDLVGGYPNRPGVPLDMMTSRSRSQYATFARTSECPTLYRAFNTIQRTPWRVNRRSFEVLAISVRQKWTDVGFMGTLPDKPKAPAHDFAPGDPAWLDFKYKRREWLILEERFIGEALAAGRTLSIGEIYEDFDRWFLPHQIDFRGRCYPIGCPISYQGPDWQRGIVEFADGKKIGTQEALDWLLIHGANCYGEDKLSLKDRIAWTKENALDIIRSARDPIEYRWWSEADKPFQFLSFCFEFADMMELEDPLDHVSHIPVAVDGSNNGLQIYSMLMRDEQGCRATNCVPVDEPQDAYQEVADRLTERMHEYAAGHDDAKLRRRAKRVLEFLQANGMDGFPRKSVKRPVMTQPYGATVYSCQSYLVAWYHDFVRGKTLTGLEKPFPERDAYKVWHWVGSIVWDIMGEVLFRARHAMDWIRQASDILAAHDVDFAWTTPLGMRCGQDYKKGTVERVGFHTGRQMYIRVWNATEHVDGNKAANGSCPNYIHSLDASAMFLTVERASLAGVTHFQMIHDSFGTHAADMPVLAQVLRESYIQILQGNPLQDLRAELQSSLPEGVELPEVPERGSVDISTLMDSKYFFS